MLIKTAGIIFQTKKYSETSIIADIYTEAKGLRSYIISGVRSKKAKVSASLLQIMSLVDLVVYHRDDRDLTRIKEIKASHVYQTLPFDVRKSAVGQFMTEIARKTIRESEENAELFNFLYHSFQFLDQTEKPFGNVHIYYMLELTSFLGFIPNGDFEKSTPFFDMKEGIFVSNPPPHPHYLDEEMSEIVGRFLESGFESCHEIKINRQSRHELVRHLLDYYRLHIENFPPIYAHSILKEVLE